MKLDLKSLYKQEIVPAMIEAFGYKNIEQVPNKPNINMFEITCFWKITFVVY